MADEGRCQMCNSSIGNHPVYVKYKDTFLACCTGYCAERLVAFHALVEHAKEGAPQLTLLFRPPIDRTA